MKKRILEDVQYSAGKPVEEEGTSPEFAEGRCKKIRGTAVPWSYETHENFVSAIFETGLAHASPSIIAQKMILQSPDVTSERLKSHLQKFRKRKDKEKENFLEEYNEALIQILSDDVSSNSSPVVCVKKEIKESPRSIPLGGRAVALLSCAAKTEEEESILMEACGPDPDKAKQLLKKEALRARTTSGMSSPRLCCPALSDKEKASHLGKAIASIGNLVQEMERYLLEQREINSSATKACSPLPEGPIGSTCSSHSVGASDDVTTAPYQAPQSWHVPASQERSFSSPKSVLGAPGATRYQEEQGIQCKRTESLEGLYDATTNCLTEAGWLVQDSLPIFVPPMLPPGKPLDSPPVLLAGLSPCAEIAPH